MIDRKNIPLFGICVLLLTLVGLLLSMRCDQTMSKAHGLLFPPLHSPLLSIESIIYPHSALFFYGSILGSAALSVLILRWVGYRSSMLCGALAATGAAAIALQGTADSPALLMTLLTLRVAAGMLLLLSALSVMLRLGARSTAQWRLLLGCTLPLLPLLALAIIQYSIDPHLFGSQSELGDTPLQVSTLMLGGCALLGLLRRSSFYHLRAKKPQGARGQSIAPVLLLLLVLCAAAPVVDFYESSCNMMFYTSSYYGKYMSALLPVTLILMLLTLAFLPIKGGRIVKWSFLTFLACFLLSFVLIRFELLGISDGEAYYELSASALTLALAYALLYLLIPLLVARVYQTGRHPSVYVGACFVMAMLLGGLF